MLYAYRHTFYARRHLIFLEFVKNRQQLCF